MTDDDREAANERAVGRMIDSEPVLTAVEAAGDVIPGMGDRTLLHAGPPLEWAEMIDPLRGALTGAARYEGWAETDSEAEAMIESGGIELAPNSHHRAAAPLAGVVSPSMPVFVVHNEPYGTTAYTNLNEGLGRTLRFGAYDDEVDDRLAWMETQLQPALSSTLAVTGPIELKPIVVQALQRGDECHNRNASASDLLVRRLAPALFRSSVDRETASEVIEFVTGNEHFFLNLSMPAALSSLQAAAAVEGSSVVTRLCANGTDFGVRIGGSEEWYTAPSVKPEGNFLDGFDRSDAAPVVGDSLATEATGLGGFALAGAPAISDYLGITAADCLDATERMYDLTVAEHDDFRIPALDDRGTPVGIEVQRVVESGTEPVFNAGMAHEKRGDGQVGAGVGRVPLELFERALAEL